MPPLRYFDGELKPATRGWIHDLSLVVIGVYGIVLVMWASSRATDTERRVASALVFVGCTMVCFAVSAFYHLHLFQTPETENRARRTDHACVALLCFGNAFPMALLVYSHTSMIVFLVVSSVITAAAMVYSWAKELEERHANRAASVMYCLLVLSQFIFAHEVYWWTPHWVFALWITVYVVQGLGALCYQLDLGSSDKWYCCCPPSVFGAHELFHLASVLGQLLLCVVHFYVIALR